MKIGVLTPTLGKRIQFLEHSNYLIERQTRKPFVRDVVSDKQTQFPNDINVRYRIGCERLFNVHKCDCVLFMEDDDWYRSDYIEQMVANWERIGKPVLFGVNNTVYYQLKMQKYSNYIHPGRASMMSTLVTKDIMKMQFPNVKFLDAHIWAKYWGPKSAIQLPGLSIGIKHGMGICGGDGHTTNTNLDMWYNQDTDYAYLESAIGDDLKSIEFYKVIGNLLNKR